MQEPLPADRIDPDAAKVLRRLAGHGFAAYLVGGCVRDLLLDRTPKDFDIATGARPRQVRRLFRNSRVIGRRFRLAHIHFGPRVIEVATFRAPPLSDDESDLYIRRDNVYGTEKQDAFRRDFTINGLFYDLEHGRVIDHVGGLDDLRAGVLRTIGDPDVRLREDPIRILRAAKFAGRLGFELADDLAAAAVAHAQDLRKAAPPRVLEELYRLLSGEGSARAFAILDELSALKVLLPEILPLDPEYFASLKRLEGVSGGSRDGVSQSLMLAVLLWPCVRGLLLAEEPHDKEGLVQEILLPFAERLTFARRDLARARQTLAAQARLAGEPKGRAARRFSRRDFIAEGLRLRGLVGPLDPDAPDTLSAWKESAPKDHKHARKRRRRRRRRRRPAKKGDPT